MARYSSKNIKLNAKQIAFTHAFARNGENATKAAQEAGYSKKTAHAIGCMLLKHVKVKELLTELRAKRDEAQQRATQASNVQALLDRERLLTEIGKLAYSDMDNFARVTDRKSVELIPTSKRPGLGAAIRKISRSKHGNSLELHDKKWALDMLAKISGVVPDSDKPKNPSGDDAEGKVKIVIALPENGRQAKKEEK